LVDAHLDAGSFDEFLGVGDPGILVALYEGGPAQHTKSRAGLRRIVRRRLRIGGWCADQLAAGQARGESRRGADHITSRKFQVVSSCLPSLVFRATASSSRRAPVPASNRGALAS